MKNKFLSGVLTGLASSTIILAIVLTFWYTQVYSPEIQSNSIAEAADSNESTIKVLSKLKTINSLLDKYSLNEVDQTAVEDGIYKGVMSSLKDPYAAYYTKAEYQAIKESSNGTYSGIGSTVSQNVQTGVVTIVKPFVNAPAYKAGILPGDIIYKVDDKEVTGLDLTEVVSYMKGKEGTKVKITIIREGESEPLEFTVNRKKVEVPTIEYEMLSNKIGYISISEFDTVTIDQFKKAIDDLDKQGQKGLIIDLRNNGGGVLDAATEMLDRILPKGICTYTEDKYKNREDYKSTDKEVFTKPMAVLINGNSASASEIFAGALQDYNLATLVGTTSFGKGIVQSVIPLSDGTAIKVTVSKYYTPNGRNIHGTGIEPDVEVELKDELKQKVVIEKSEDNQLQKAVDTVMKKIK